MTILTGIPGWIPGWGPGLLIKGHGFDDGLVGFELPAASPWCPTAAARPSPATPGVFSLESLVQRFVVNQVDFRSTSVT